MYLTFTGQKAKWMPLILQGFCLNEVQTLGASLGDTLRLSILPNCGRQLFFTVFLTFMNVEQLFAIIFLFSSLLYAFSYRRRKLIKQILIASCVLVLHSKRVYGMP